MFCADIALFSPYALPLMRQSCVALVIACFQQQDCTSDDIPLTKIIQVGTVSVSKIGCKMWGTLS